MGDLPEAAKSPTRRLVHDLRNPLAVIDGFATLLERDEGALTLEQRADFARRIRVAAEEMRGVLDRTP